MFSALYHNETFICWRYSLYFTRILTKMNSTGLLYMGEGSTLSDKKNFLKSNIYWCDLTLFPQTTNLQQITLKIFSQNMETFSERTIIKLWQKKKLLILLLAQCFPFLVKDYPFNYIDFLFFWQNMLKSSAAELSSEGKGLNHTNKCWT